MSHQVPSDVSPSSGPDGGGGATDALSRSTEPPPPSPRKVIAAATELPSGEATGFTSATGPASSARPAGGRPHPAARAGAVSDVTVIYRLYFPGKVRRFISRRQAVCKHAAPGGPCGWPALRAYASARRREQGLRPEPGRGPRTRGVLCHRGRGLRLPPAPLPPQSSGHTHSRPSAASRGVRRGKQCVCLFVTREIGTLETCMYTQSSLNV